MHGFRRSATISLCALSLFAPRAAAVPLATGDLVVAAEGTFNPPRPVRLLRVDEQSGAQSTITTNGMLDQAGGCFIFDTDGSILMGATNALVRIDPATGAQTGFSVGGQFASVGVLGVVINRQNELITATSNRKIVRVDRTTGAQTLLTTVSGIGPVTDIAVMPNGDYLATAIDDTNFVGRLVRIDHTTFAQSIVSFGNLLQLPGSVEVGPTGQIYVSDFDSGILQIDPVSGLQFSLGYGGVAADIALRTSTNELFVADLNSGVYRFDLGTHVQTLISPVAAASRLGFATVPAPSPILALTAAAAPLAITRRRRHAS